MSEDTARHDRVPLAEQPFAANNRPDNGPYVRVAPRGFRDKCGRDIEAACVEIREVAVLAAGPGTVLQPVSRRIRGTVSSSAPSRSQPSSGHVSGWSYVSIRSAARPSQYSAGQ